MMGTRIGLGGLKSRGSSWMRSTLERSDCGRYDLHAFVVMSTHVHLLVHPHVEAAVILKNLKGITARRSNVVLGRVGKIFWLDESFDHWIRGDVEFAETRAYIENNPVRAGVVERAEDYPWSSAYRERSGLEA